MLLALLIQSFRRVLLLEVSRMKGTQTNKQVADLEDKRTSLRNQISRWREIQLLYMPCVGTLLTQCNAATTATESPTIALAKSIPLHLPSSLPEQLRQLPDISTVLDKELRLRIAQADDSLADIRRQHRIISGLWQFKKTNDTGLCLPRFSGSKGSVSSGEPAPNSAGCLGAESAGGRYHD